MATPLPSRPWTDRLPGIVSLVVVVGITWWSALAVGVQPGTLVANLGKIGRLLSESWPPEVSFLPRILAPLVETLQIAVVGTVIGGSLALPAAILAANGVARPRWLYLLDRNGMAVLRTLPDLFWAILFATAVGFGPFAGCLALSVFSLGIVAKLLSESIESIDFGLMEAVEASGGTWLETVRFAVIPQVALHYASYVLYVLELNVRASMVLGLVGAGGLGMVLESSRTTFQYQRVTLILLAVLVVVLLIERLAEWARLRLR